MSEISYKDFLSAIEGMNGFYLAQLTDSLKSGRIEDGSIATLNEEKVLDLRAFNSDREVHLFRGCIGESFQMRIADDSLMSAVEKEGIIDEAHYLETDTERFGRNVNSANLLDFEGAEKFTKISIRNYLGYYETGQAYVKDWRVVGFM